LVYQIQTFTASGTLTVSNSGMVDILVVGGGGGGGVGATYTTGSGGGAGGYLLVSGTAYLQSGSHTVTVGAGGTAQNSGITSRLGSYYAVGGGCGTNGDE
jgi:hypothetical protein